MESFGPLIYTRIYKPWRKKKQNLRITRFDSEKEMSYAVYRDIGANDGVTVERVSVDIPDRLDEWKAIVRRHPIVLLYVWKQSCMPCLQIKNRYEQWLHSLKKKYNDTDNAILFVKDCLDRYGPLPPEGTPSAVHSRMANAVPFFILYYDNRIVYRHARFEPVILEEYLDICVQDYMEKMEQKPPATGDPQVTFYH